MKKKFTHLDDADSVRMVDVGEKRVTRRCARARCSVRMNPETLRAINENRIRKGNVLTTAKLAGIMAAKRVHELIPLCHPLHVDHIDLQFIPDAGRGILEIRSSVTVNGRTGAEMEALQAVSQAALTVYDMCKAVDREMVIAQVMLMEKSGGRSGLWKREQG
jgi:cyclic pyranopterin phosphate synthase